MSRYLVTGGMGFIGSHIVDLLVQEGHQVRILDISSQSPWKDGIPVGVEYVQGDVSVFEAILPAFEGVDGVFHLAALPRVAYSIDHPVETAKTNITGTLHVLAAAHAQKVKRVVYSASSAVYGNARTLPMTTDLPAEPLSPYALHKYVGECYAKQYATLFGLETVSLRYFNVYGPRMADEGAYGTVLSIFKKQRQSGEPLTIDGTGEQTRDFVHVFDVARANMLAMQMPQVGQGEVLNIGSGERHSIKEIAELFGGPISYTPSRRGDAFHTLADIQKTQTLLGWTPRITFTEGIQAFLEEHGIRVS